MQNRGFTLIEMLVAMSVFVIVIGIVLGIFISGIQQQRRALANQVLLDQTSYALEFMSRALRMAGKQLDSPSPSCLSRGNNYGIVNARLRFINTLEGNDCQEFYLENEQLKYQKQANLGSPPPAMELTSPKLKVTSLRFHLSGESQADNLQPRITIFLDIESKGIIQRPPFLKIQTTLSQRKIDVRY